MVQEAPAPAGGRAAVARRRPARRDRPDARAFGRVDLADDAVRRFRRVG